MRVVRVEVLEQRDTEQSGRGGEPDQCLYDLEVEDNHNYFAGQVLVHNCHRLKNPKALRTRAARLIAAGVPHLLFLSATPMLNRREELWSPLSMIDPNQWGTFWQFKRTYCNDEADAQHWHPKTREDLARYRSQAANQNRELLAKRMSSVYLRRTREVLGLKDPIIRPIPVELQGKFLSDYRQAQADLITFLRTRGLPSRGAELAQALVKLGVLRRLVGRAKAPAAIAVAKDLLEADPERKLVIYAIHQDVVKEITRGLADYGVEKIVGATSPKERYEANVRFQTQGGPRVMLISEAGEEGIDLFRAEHLILAERGWNPKADDQAIGRILRRGQIAEYVTVHKLIAEHTVDVKIDRLIEKKREDVTGTVLTHQLLAQLLEDDK